MTRSQLSANGLTSEETDRIQRKIWAKRHPHDPAGSPPPGPDTYAAEDNADPIDDDPITTVADIPDHWICIQIDQDIQAVGESIGAPDLLEEYPYIWLEPQIDSNGDLVDYGRVYGCQGTPYSDRLVWKVR